MLPIGTWVHDERTPRIRDQEHGGTRPSSSLMQFWPESRQVVVSQPDVAFATPAFNHEIASLTNPPSRQYGALDRGSPASLT